MYTKPKTFLEGTHKTLYEPVQFLGDGNCLYHSVSKGLFAKNGIRTMGLNKTGSLSHLKSNTEALLENLRDSNSL